jgi:hypothetical protein
VSNETLMNFPPNIPYSCGALPLPLPARALFTAKLRTPVQSNVERGAPNPESEPASARAISRNPKEIPRFKQDGNSSTPARRPLRPWAGQDHPGTTLCAAQLGKTETMFYNISLIAGQIF